MRLNDSTRRLLHLSRIAASAGLRDQDHVGVRFGDVAVRLGYVTHADVEAALREQRQDSALGQPHRLIGEILVERGDLDESQCLKVVETLVQLAERRRAELGRGPVDDLLQAL